MEKNGNFRDSSRSLIGLICFALLFFLHLEGTVEGTLLVEEPFFIQPSPFSYQGIKSISFYTSSTSSEKTSLKAAIQESLKGHTRMKIQESQAVNAEALLTDIQFYISIQEGINKEITSVSISAWINGESTTKYRGKIPIFTQLLVFEKESPQKILQKIQKILAVWLEKVEKDNPGSFTCNLFLL